MVFFSDEDLSSIKAVNCEPRCRQTAKISRAECIIATVCRVCRAWRNGLSLYLGAGGVFIGGHRREDSRGDIVKNREKDKLSGRITDTQGKMRNFVIDGLRCSGLLSDPVLTFFIFFLGS